MILRDNYLAVMDYLAYRRDVLQLDPGTVEITWTACRHMLEWADSQPLEKCFDLRPTFPEYIGTKTGKKTGKPMTPKYQVKMCENVRFFYQWARTYGDSRYRNVPDGWIDTIKVRRSRNVQSTLAKRQYWTVDNVLKIAAYIPKTLSEARTQAAVCFLFLSGMRLTAFTTLPVSCVDIPRRRIEQLPEKGVITKNRKAAITFLLPIPELLCIVERWDTKIKESGCAMWFPPIATDGTRFSHDDSPTTGRRRAFWRTLTDLCQSANVPYLSAHKLRHGHAVYGVQHAETVEQLKAISQNLMHANLGITDSIYGKLPEDVIGNVVSHLGKSNAPQETPNSNIPNLTDIDPKVLELALQLITAMQQGRNR